MKLKPWSTAMWKTVVSSATHYFTSACVTTLEANGINALTVIGGAQKASCGLTTLGSPYKFIDVTRSEYYVTAAVKDALVALRANSDKIPYDQSGLNQVLGALISAMDSCVRVGAVGEYRISIPAFEQTSTVERENRVLNNVIVAVRLVGDIHTFNLGLTITI